MMHTLRVLRSLALFPCLLAMASSSEGALTLLSQFDPGEGTQINAIGYDPVADEVFVHFSHAGPTHRYQPDGTFLGSITVGSPSNQGNDSDLDFASEPIDIGGTIVPANSLLIIENDSDPPQIIAADKTTGAVLATQDINGALIGTWVGGAWHHDLNRFFNVSWSPDEIDQVDASNGNIDDTFAVSPGAAPFFDVFFGDVDILSADGNLYVVSDDNVSGSNEKVRVLSPSGIFLQDLALPAGVDNLSGIAFNDLTGQAWVSSTDGEVFLLGGFDAIPEPAGAMLVLLGAAVALLRRR